MAKKTVSTSGKKGNKKSEKRTKMPIFEPGIPELMKSLSKIHSLEKLESTLEEIFDDINDKFYQKDFKNNEANLRSLKEYEQKVCALRDIWKEKIIMDVNLSVHIDDRAYHKRFNFHDFNLNKIKARVESLNDDYKKYFYLKWVKCNYRILNNMNWDSLYLLHDDISKLCIYIDRNIKKYYNMIIKFKPNAFIESSEFEYDKPEQPSVTKQFMSKLIMSIEASQIKIDRHKFCESFGMKYDNTVRTAYNKTNSKLNDTTKKFFSNFNMYLSDTEKEELSTIYKDNQFKNH